MDAAVSRKIIKYRGICEKAGWTFEPFVCDTYGAMTQNARTTLSLAVKKLKPEDRYYESTSGYAAVWRGVSAAIVSRAAEQYLRAMEHYLVETPAADYSDLCNSGSNTLSSTGIYHMYQPSLSEPMLTDDVESGDMPPSSVAPASANTGLTSAPQHPTAPVSSGQRPPRMMQLPSGEVRDLPHCRAAPTGSGGNPHRRDRRSTHLFQHRIRLAGRSTGHMVSGRTRSLSGAHLHEGDRGSPRAHVNRRES